MLAAVSPADRNRDETLSTLRYANNAKRIVNKVTVNEDVSEKLIRDLRKQIEELRAQLGAGGPSAEGGPESAEAQAARAALQEQIENLEREKSSDWEERARLSAELEAERQKNLSASLTQEISSIREAKAAALRRKQDLEEQRRALVERERAESASYVERKRAQKATMASYERFQADFEKAATAHERAAAEAEMAALLDDVQAKRATQQEARARLEAIKAEIARVDAALLEAKAEALASAAVLEDNDRLRNEIQEELRRDYEARQEEMLATALAAKVAELDAREAAAEGRGAEDRARFEAELRAREALLTERVEMVERERAFDILRPSGMKLRPLFLPQARSDRSTRPRGASTARAWRRGSPRAPRRTPR